MFPAYTSGWTERADETPLKGVSHIADEICAMNCASDKYQPQINREICDELYVVILYTD